MSDPARVYAKKYAELEAQRDAYKAALVEIAAFPCECSGCDAWTIAHDALGETDSAPREEGS